MNLVPHHFVLELDDTIEVRHEISSRPQSNSRSRSKQGRRVSGSVFIRRALTSSGTKPLLPTAMAGLMPLASWASTLLTELDREGA